ncbi:hypothetical protein E4T54_03245 [Legionella geestiana]|nr:hypothetical protein E4T54_03245 [Legionella geestiana]
MTYWKRRSALSSWPNASVKKKRFSCLPTVTIRFINVDVHMDAVESDIGEIWHFPEIVVTAPENPPDMALPAEEDTVSPEETLSETASDTPPEEPPTEILPDIQGMLEQNLRNQALYLDTIAFEMRQILEGFDHELYRQIVGIVQKVTRKIIHREIALNPDTLKTMVIEAMSRINTDNAPCTLHVAKEDKALFDTVYAGENVSVTVDETLAPGDFRIKTLHSTLISAIDARIHALLGLEA